MVAFGRAFEQNGGARQSKPQERALQPGITQQPAERSCEPKAQAVEAVEQLTNEASTSESS